MSHHFNENRRLSKLSWVLLGVVVLIILLTGFLLVKKTFFTTKPDPNASAYSAVFLANGQVYFGVISGEQDSHEKYLVLKNIFYLQAQQSLQSSAQTQPFSLIKLGKELHGPTDEMFINRSQILFYENLRKDSSVVKSIEGYR